MISVHSKGALAAALALLVAGPAAPQEPPSEEAEVSELVVRPATPGPAWWRVSDADASVYILVIPPVTPLSMSWDKSLLQIRLDGANRVLTPFDFSIVRSLPGIATALIQSPLALAALRGKAPEPEKIPLEIRLGPELSARFAAVRESIGQPADRYAMMSYSEAAARLTEDYRRQSKLVDGEVWRAVDYEIDRRKLRTDSLYKFVLPPGRLEGRRIENVGGPECIEHALTAGIERMNRQKAAAEDWAQGDVRGLVRPPPSLPGPTCTRNGGAIGVFPGTPMAIRMEEDYLRQHVDSIEDALKRPGRTVAIFNAASPFGGAADTFLGRNGVLTRLQAKGYAVASPKVLDEETPKR